MYGTDKSESSLQENKIYVEEPLLKKYNLVIEQLDYKFIGNCTNTKELERIIRVLESGQEGTYPDLLNFARKRLADVDPKNKLLRESIKIITKSDLSSDHKVNLLSDMEEYLVSINTDNQELSLLSKMNIKSNDPPIREAKIVEAFQTAKRDYRIKSTDYAGWDQFDVDTKLLEMDLEEERMKIENNKKADMKKKLNTVCINKSINTNVELTKIARDICNAGKECLAEKDYESAIYYFNNSIAVKPANETYAYRGLTYAKCEKYSKAMTDLTKVLQIDSNNTVALYGQTIVLKGLKKYEEAMKCLENLLKTDPNSESYQKLSSELRSFLGTNEQNSRRSIRMQIQ